MPASRRKRVLRWVVIGLFCMASLGLFASWFVAGALVAACPKEIGEPPGELNATEFTVNSESGSLISGWHTRPDSIHGVVVLLHGIRGSRLSMLDRARMLHEAGYAIILIDLQAHGESTGDAITAGHLERHDVQAAISFARQEHPDQPIGVIGVSLGGAAALLASPLGIDALVLESVYPNIQAAINNRVAARLGGLSSIPTSLLLLQLQYRFGISPSELRPIDCIPKIACPILVASGTEDLHTTEAETQSMFSVALEPKQLWLVKGAAHVDLMEHDPEQYQQKILRFLGEHLRKTQEKHPKPPKS